ncbi:MAG: acyl--CoA ligase [Oscillospiraceae bacterium]|jgi:long-chain acyl-CoA synthetase|nr:acyl--CoA ligase [Oscillospiraceae bacterium]
MKEINMSLYQKWFEVNGEYLSSQSSEYFGIPYTVDQEITMMDNYARSYLQFNDKGENTVTFCVIANPTTIDNFMGFNKMGIKANFISDSVLMSNVHEYLDVTKTDTLIILDVFLLRNPALISAIASTTIENIVITSFTDGIPKTLSTALIHDAFESKIGQKAAIFAKLNDGFNQINPRINVMNHDEYYKAGSNSNTYIESVYNPNETALNLYTGGSTGVPKGVEITNEGIINQAHKYPKMKIDVVRNDRNGVFIPPNHPTSFIHSILIPSFFGAVQVYQPVYDKLTFARDLEKLKLNISMAAPSHYYTLIKAKYGKRAFRNLKGAYTGGEAVPNALWHQTTQALRKGGSSSDLIVGYGMSELLGMAIFSPSVSGLENRAGNPNPGVDVRIRNRFTDELLEGNNVKGLVEIKSDNPMKCYFNLPELTSEVYTEDGYLKTKDIGIRDELGYYDVRGRADDSYIDNQGNLVELNEIELYAYEISSDVALEVEAVGLPIEEQDTKIPVIHVVLQQEWENKAPEAISTIYNRFISKYESAEIPETVRVPRGIKVRTIFATNPISAKRDIASLKEERDGYYHYFEEENNVFEIAFQKDGTIIKKSIVPTDIFITKTEL